MNETDLIIMAVDLHDIKEKLQEGHDDKAVAIYLAMAAESIGHAVRCLEALIEREIVDV